MNIIFLDIDGVLNSTNYMNLLYKKKSIYQDDTATRDSYGSLFDPTCVEYFRLLIHRTDAKIVISSTWRMSGLAVLQNMWKDRGLPGEVIDTTLWFGHPNPNYQPDIKGDSTKDNSRGYQIHDWLLKNPNPDGSLLTSYLIIDDDHDMRSDQLNHFVQTSNMYGFDRTSFDRSIEIFTEFGTVNSLK